jgi:hypothetical protein
MAFPARGVVWMPRIDPHRFVAKKLDGLELDGVGVSLPLMMGMVKADIPAENRCATKTEIPRNGDRSAYRSASATFPMPFFLSYLARAYAQLGQFDEAWRWSIALPVRSR